MEKKQQIAECKKALLTLTIGDLKDEGLVEEVQALRIVVDDIFRISNLFSKPIEVNRRGPAKHYEKIIKNRWQQ